MSLINDYIASSRQALMSINETDVLRLATAIRAVWAKDSQVLLCGNGGSSANAVHMCADLIYGISPMGGDGVRAVALTANQSVMTCLANDINYDQVFSYQVAVLGRPGDLLVVFSGSGNSPNVVNAIIEARRRGLMTAAIVGFSGGRCRELADIVVHVPIDDMQISEDVQQTIFHMMTRWLASNRPVRRVRIAEPAAESVPISA